MSDSDFLPELNVTRPRPGVSATTQAHWITSAITAALTAGDSGLRMDRIGRRAVELAILLDRPLTDVPMWLAQPERFVTAAYASRNTDLISYATRVFPNEPKASVNALAARLDLFTMHESSKLILNADRCFSFAPVLDAPGDATCIVDLGQPPHGLHELQLFYGAFLLHDLAASALTRRTTPESVPTLVVLDEWQELLR